MPPSIFCAGVRPAMLLLLAVCLCAPLALLPSPVSAQQTTGQVEASDTIPRYQLPGVTVSSRRAILSAGGASVVRASLDSMALAPSSSLGEVLRDLPLVRVRTNSRGEEQPSLRGAGSRQVAVILDGVPLTLGWDHRSDLSLVPLQGASRLDLHRGLPSLLFGPNVLGGVIEVSFTRSADGAGQSPADGSRGLRASSRVDSSGEWRLDSHGASHHTTGDLDWQLRGGVGLRRSSGFELPAGATDTPDLLNEFLVADDGTRLNSDLERIQGFGSVRVGGRDGGWGALSLTGHSTTRGIPPEAHTTTPRLWREPEQTASLLSLGGGKAFDFALGRTELSATAGLRFGDTEREVFETARYGTAVERQWEEGRTSTLRLSARSTTDRGVSVQGALTAAEVVHEEGAPGESGERYRQRLWSAGAELEAPLDRGPGGRTNVAGGLVIEGADTPDAGPWEPSPGLTTWGARVGVSTLLTSAGTSTAHLSLSRRARFPSLRERYSGALGRFLPNPELRAETQLAAEGGVTMTSGRSELQAVLFLQRTSDGIARVSIESGDQRLLQRVNRDRVTATGIELLGTVETDRVGVEADLTLQRTTVVAGAGTETPEYEPRWRAALSASSSPDRLLGAGGSLPTVLGSAGLRGSLQLEGSQFCLDPAAGELRTLSASHQLDMGIDLPIALDFGSGRGLTLGMGVANLTDTLAYDQCGLPRPGRTLHLSVRIG